MKLYPIAAAASLAVALSGCALHIGSGPQPIPTVTVTATPARSQGDAPGSGGSSGTTAPATPVAATSPAAAPATGLAPMGRCHTSMLRMRVGSFGAAAGQRYAILTLTNISHVTCSMYGYVGMQLVFWHGPDVPANVVRTDRAAERLFRLVPGGRAWTRLHWTIFPAPDEASPACEPDGNYLWVTPPDEISQLGKPWVGGLVCQHGQIAITPVQPGTPSV